jgi:hypothetical protein
MKKTLIGIVLVAACLYGGAWAVVASMKQRYTPRPWPENLGTLDEASKRYRDTETNAAAETLTKLLPAIDIKTIKEPLGDYYRAELERTGDQVQPPPPNVAAFLAQHDAQMNAVRDHVLTAGPIRWVQHFEFGHDAPVPNLLTIMSASKLFTGRALAKSASHDATSWDDLHAVWLLDRELLERPELISQLVGLAGTRMANGAAAKMPLPAPAWLNEVQSFDYRHRFAASYQAEAWMIRHAPARGTVQPFFDACTLDAAEEMRVWTNDLVSANRCDLSPVRPISIAPWNLLAKVAMPSFSGAWQRFARFQAELEATEKILAMRRGETPSAKTVCSDGTWAVAATSLKFSRDIAVPPPGIKYPLAYSR